MKLNSTYLLIDSGHVAEQSEWAEAYKLISESISKMRWPEASLSRTFRIPRIVSIGVGSTYLDGSGRSKRVRGKKKTLRNGVRPLRDQFRQWMAEQDCKAEKPLSLAPFFQELRLGGSGLFAKYPQHHQQETVEFNESVGSFDFWFETIQGFKTVVEWETGNISSSHRSLNKMSLALMGGLADAAVLVVPSRMLYVHLTDRIGNIRELQPYFFFWSRCGSLIANGLLAVMEVEHDELFDSKDLRDFIPTGFDGNSKRRSSKQRHLAD